MEREAVERGRTVVVVAVADRRVSSRHVPASTAGGAEAAKNMKMWAEWAGLINTPKEYLKEV